MSDNDLESRPILQDSIAESADPSLPAFFARPNGAPVYHGFPLIRETEMDGWVLGAITAFEEPDGCTSGDAFVQAPDGSRAGIVWEVGEGELSQIAPITEDRWGVWAVWLPSPIRTVHDLASRFTLCFRSCRQFTQSSGAANKRLHRTGPVRRQV